jgi:hypothetical protein
VYKEHVIVHNVRNLSMRYYETRWGNYRLLLKVKANIRGDAAAYLMESALFWVMTQRGMVILYRRFGTTYRFHLQWSRSPRRRKKTWNHGYLMELKWPNVATLWKPYLLTIYSIQDNLKSHTHSVNWLDCRRYSDVSVAAGAYLQEVFWHQQLLVYHAVSQISCGVDIIFGPSLTPGLG